MTLGQTLFGFAGRIGRGTFWLLIIAVFMLDLAVVALVSDWIRFHYLEAGIPHRPGGDVIGAGFGLLVVGIASAWAAVGLMVKRAHDLQRSGWWLVIGLIPVYGLARLVMDLGFLEGSSGANRFGEGASIVRRPQRRQVYRPVVLDMETPAHVQETEVEPLPDPALAAAPLSSDAALSFDVVQSDVAEGPSEAGVEPEQAHREVSDVQPVDSSNPVHPLMAWGKTYRADLHWPEFHAYGSIDFPEGILAPTPEAAPEVSAAGMEDASGLEVLVDGQLPELHPADDEADPSPVPTHAASMAWMPAPSHQAYVDLEAHTSSSGTEVRPANPPV